ncbi:MAG: hypothetical protein AAGH15_06515 [Myxococcota bacterium]
MRLPATAALALALFASSATAQAPDPADAAKAAEVWDGYIAALVARNGSAAAALVMPDTHAWYERMARLALRGSAEEVRSLDLMGRMTTLMFRARLPADTLERLSGRELFALAVDRGWVGSQLPRGFQLTRVDGARGFGTFQTPAGTSPELELMRRAPGGDGWRLNLMQVMNLGRDALQQVLQGMADQAGTDVDTALLGLLSQVVGRRLGPEIWQPLRP